MTDNHRPVSRRARLLTGLGIVGASLLAATVVAGVGFAGGSISASQYQYGKVTICHHTHSKKHPYVTITVSQAAWPAHQRHGDTLGPCTGTSSPAHHGHGHEGGKSHDGNGSSSSTSDATSPSTGSTTSSPSHGNGGGDSGHGDSGHGNSGHGL